MMDRIPDGPWKGLAVLIGGILILAFMWGAAVAVADLLVNG